MLIDSKRLQALAGLLKENEDDDFDLSINPLSNTKHIKEYAQETASEILSTQMAELVVESILETSQEYPNAYSSSSDMAIRAVEIIAQADVYWDIVDQGAEQAGMEEDEYAQEVDMFLVTGFVKMFEKHLS